MATTAELQAAAVAAAQKYNVPTSMFLWQIGQESGWNPNAKNANSSATGLGQFISSTAASFDIDPTDPYQSLDAAAKYDAQLYAQTGSWQSALTSYGTLNGASSSTIAAFNAALAQGNGTTVAATDTNTDSGIWSTAKSIFNNSAFGLATDTVKNLSGNGDSTSGSWDFTKILGTGTFIILGIIVIVLAILSNKTVRTMAVSAA